MSSLSVLVDFRDLLTNAALGYPIAWPNETFNAPEPPAPWLSVQVESRLLQPVDLGANVWQEEGTFYVDVNVPAGTGTDIARAIAKSVANVFRGLGPRFVVYLGGSISNGQIGDESGVWWTMTVSLDWKYQDVDPDSYLVNDLGIVTDEHGNPIGLA